MIPKHTNECGLQSSFQVHRLFWASQTVWTLANCLIQDFISRCKMAGASNPTEPNLGLLPECTETNRTNVCESNITRVQNFVVKNCITAPVRVKHIMRFFTFLGGNMFNMTRMNVCIMKSYSQKKTTHDTCLSESKTKVE